MVQVALLSHQWTQLARSTRLQLSRDVVSGICSHTGDSMKPANKIALVLITFFFGAIGGHKYYVKKHGLGVLYLVFIWTGIPSLIALIEFIIYLVKSEDELAEAYPDTLSAGATAGFIIGAMVLAMVLVGVGVFLLGTMLGLEPA